MRNRVLTYFRKLIESEDFTTVLNELAFKCAKELVQQVKNDGIATDLILD